MTSVSSTKKLKNFINEHMKVIRESLEDLGGNVEDEILKIKLSELLNYITEIKNNEKVDDNHLVALMNYYELIQELKRAKQDN